MLHSLKYCIVTKKKQFDYVLIEKIVDIVDDFDFFAVNIFVVDIQSTIVADIFVVDIQLVVAVDEH